MGGKDAGKGCEVVEDVVLGGGEESMRRSDGDEGKGTVEEEYGQ